MASDTASLTEPESLLAYLAYLAYLTYLMYLAYLAYLTYRRTDDRQMLLRL